MSHIDVDAKRAARREALQEPVTVTLHSQEFTLQPELPYDGLVFQARLVAGDSSALIDLLKVMMDDESEWERFTELRPKPSAKDLDDIVTLALREYGVRRAKAAADDNGRADPLESVSSGSG